MSRTSAPALLGVTAVCRELNVSESTVIRYAGNGTLKFIRDSSGKRLFARSEVNSLKRHRKARA